MNIKRAIAGPFFSIVFLIFFAYIISGVQWIAENAPYGLNVGAYLGSVSDSVTDVEPPDVIGSILDEQIQFVSIGQPKLNLSAKAAISFKTSLYDKDEIIVKKDADMQLPIASLTKLMTAIIVLDNYNLSDIIVINKVADKQESLKQDLKLGDTMSVGTFLQLMIVASSNKAAYTLAEKAGVDQFVALMNQKARDLDLKNTFFADPTGLSPENISTVNDLAILIKHIIKNYPFIAEISRIKELYVPNIGSILNINQLLPEFSSTVFGKTGFTTDAKGCLVIVMGDPKTNNYLINVVLGSNDRFSEMKNLISWVSIIYNQ